MKLNKIMLIARESKHLNTRQGNYATQPNKLEQYLILSVFNR